MWRQTMMEFSQGEARILQTGSLKSCEVSEKSQSFEFLDHHPLLPNNPPVMTILNSPPARSRARADLMRIYAAAVTAVSPRGVMAQALTGTIPGAEPVPAIVSKARGVRLLAIGKAALGMAAEAEHLLGERIIEGLVIAPTGGSSDAGAAPLRSRVMVAAHPLPDESSIAAARAALELAARAQPGELVMLALSGGASALIAAGYDQRRPDARRREHPRAEHRAQASLGDQRRSPARGHRGGCGGAQSGSLRCPRQ
jgi:hypothetical protein